MTAPDTVVRKTPVELIQDAIVLFLKDGLSSRYLIQAFPDSPDSFDMGSAQKAALVQYSGSRYAQPTGPGNGAQMRRPEFAIHIYLRSVGEPVRAPFEIDQVRLALQGQRIQGVDLFVTRDGLIDEDQSLWRYLVEISCTPFPAVPLPHSAPRPFITDFTKTEGA